MSVPDPRMDLRKELAELVAYHSGRAEDRRKVAKENAGWAEQHERNAALFQRCLDELADTRPDGRGKARGR